MKPRKINKLALINLVLIAALLPLDFGWFAPTSVKADGGWEATPAGAISLSVNVPFDGMSEPITVRYRNTGSQTWSPSGSEPVVLSYRHLLNDPDYNGGHQPSPGVWESAFRCNNWPSQNNFWAATVGSTTSPGGTGSFTFRLCNLLDKPAGEYTEQFDLAHGTQWFYNAGWTQPVRLTINIVEPPPPPPQWAAEAVDTPANQPIEMLVEIPRDIGASDPITVRYRNIGSETWSPSGAEAVALAYRRHPDDTGGHESSPGVWESAFRCADWPDQNNLWAAIVGNTTAPNATGSFTFRLCNLLDKPAGEYTEQFDLAHGTQWFYNAGWTQPVRLTINIVEPPPPPPTTDLIAESIEVTQAIQDLKNSVPLVAGKTTAVRFYVRVEGATQVEGVRAKLHLQHDKHDNGTGTSVDSANSDSPYGTITVKDSWKRENLNDAFYFMIPSEYLISGELTLTAEVNPPGTGHILEATDTNNTTTTTIVLHERKPLTLYVYLVSMKKKPTDSNIYPDPAKKEREKLAEWLKLTYPIGTLKLLPETDKLFEHGTLSTCDAVMDRLSDDSGKTDERPLYGIVHDDFGPFECYDHAKSIAVSSAGKHWLGARQISFLLDNTFSQECSTGIGTESGYFGFNSATQEIYATGYKDIRSNCELSDKSWMDAPMWIHPNTYQKLFEHFEPTAQTSRRQTERLMSIAEPVTQVPGNTVASAPIVTITSPAGGETLGDNVTLAWSVTGADADTLTAVIEYSADDGATWHLLATDWPMQPIDIDTGTLMASDQGRFRVIVSDGEQTGESISEPFIIPNHLPTVHIRQPTAGSMIGAGMTVILDAWAYDADVGSLDGKQMTWKSDRDGVIGHGATQGVHTIAVTADDGMGGSATDTLTLIVSGHIGLRVTPHETVQLTDQSRTHTVNITSLRGSEVISWTATTSKSMATGITIVGQHSRHADRTL